MQIDEFIIVIEEEFEDVPAGTITAEDVFRELEGWSSMLALIIIAKIDSDLDVTITAEELSGAKTIDDLYQLVSGKL